VNKVITGGFECHKAGPVLEVRVFGYYKSNKKKPITK